jgi:hypothetical protein
LGHLYLFISLYLHQSDVARGICKKELRGMENQLQTYAMMGILCKALLIAHGKYKSPETSSLVISPFEETT